MRWLIIDVKYTEPHTCNQEKESDREGDREKTITILIILKWWLVNMFWRIADVRPMFNQAGISSLAIISTLIDPSNDSWHHMWYWRYDGTWLSQRICRRWLWPSHRDDGINICRVDFALLTLHKIGRNSCNNAWCFFFNWSFTFQR